MGVCSSKEDPDPFTDIEGYSTHKSPSSRPKSQPSTQGPTGITAEEKGNTKTITVVDVFCTLEGEIEVTEKYCKGCDTNLHDGLCQLFPSVSRKPETLVETTTGKTLNLSYSPQEVYAVVKDGEVYEVRWNAVVTV